MFKFLGLIGELITATFIDILYLPFNFKYKKLLKELKQESWFKECMRTGNTSELFFII